jgi:ketosteroid isomerase-like protein
MSTHTDDRVATLTSLFAAFERGDIDGYLEYLAPDVSLRFAHAEPIGRQAIKESRQEFSKVSNWIRHDRIFIDLTPVFAD